MAQLSKIELHLHLDCSLSYRVVSRLAPSVSREEFDAEFIAPPLCSSLADFLTRAPRGFQLMQSEESLRLVVEDLFEQLSADQVVYAEIRFAPLLHVAGGLTPEAVVAAVDRATEECIDATGIEARLILCTLRHFDWTQSMQTAQLVEQFQGGRVVALDLAGDEAGFPIDAHTPAFQYAIDRGLHRTAHAGEASGASSVWATLRAFQPSRVGHGIRSIEDPSLIDHLRRERIHLEVCPTSNLQTGVCGDYDQHPVNRLFRAGISLGINTDARTITNVTLEQEYARLQQYFGWSSAELMVCNREALRAAFVEEPAKLKILARLAAA
jgi:adenosine deaminase